MVKRQVVTATEFKAKCLALLDEVEQSGGSITVTKRGRPVAVVGPAPRAADRSLRGRWAGKLIEVEDLAKTDLSHLWNRLRNPRKV